MIQNSRLLKQDEKKTILNKGHGKEVKRSSFVVEHKQYFNLINASFVAATKIEQTSVVN